MFGFLALVMGGLSFAIIIIMAISFIAVILGFAVGGISYAINRNLETAKALILITIFSVIVGLIYYILNYAV